jgi:hypothetical protein
VGTAYAFDNIAIAAFCWAAFGLVSLLSELKFLIDGLDWSISHWAISYKDVLLKLGKLVSRAVSGYREFVRSTARLLHLPHLPSYLYDVIGVAALSIGCGYWLGRRGVQACETPGDRTGRNGSGRIGAPSLGASVAKCVRALRSRGVLPMLPKPVRRVVVPSRSTAPRSPSHWLHCSASTTPAGISFEAKHGPRQRQHASQHRALARAQYRCWRSRCSSRALSGSC